MKLRNINTGEEVEGNFYKTAGFCQEEMAPVLSHDESQWVPVEEEVS